MPGPLRRTAKAVAVVPALAILAVHAALTAGDSRRRRAAGDRARLIYGPVPILSFKYMSRAMRTIGYEATTVVHELYGIHAPTDFDLLARRGSWQPAAPLAARLLRWLGSDYSTFAWALSGFDVFHCFFDGGFLRRTPLRFLEVQLLHLAGKRVVVVPYGSDVAVPSAIRSLAWRDGLMRNYPDLGRREAETRRRLDYFSRTADYIVGCVVHAETLPRWDLLTTLYYPIDTSDWAPAPHGTLGHDGRSGPVVVVHAPNHRGMKGTEYLVEACRQLRDEGLDVELRLLEGVPNADVHAAMAAADIVADQFLLGFALTALEGMSLAKPVMSNLSEAGYYELHRLSTGLDECPIVSTRPDEVAAHLRDLVTDPDRRQRLGLAGRRYVETYHSYGAMARLWDSIYRHLWNGDPGDPHASLPGRLTSAPPTTG